MSAIDPVLQALLATSFTWTMTGLGAGAVFIARDVNRRIQDAMLGFAAGVMIATSVWSLLVPAIEMSAGTGVPGWLPAAAGFLSGSGFLYAVDRTMPHLHRGFRDDETEGLRTRWRRTTLLVLAITLHNIPEGLAVGVAFGAVAAGLPAATLGGAFALVLGIGIQNLPEGLAVSMPLRRDGVSPLKSFYYGQLSGTVEPLAALVGVAAVVACQPILPYALSFAAGAMIFVVVEQVVPESQRGSNTDLATLGAILGFTLMMVLDLAFA